jgi:hypothetical protein
VAESAEIRELRSDCEMMYRQYVDAENRANALRIKSDALALELKDTREKLEIAQSLLTDLATTLPSVSDALRLKLAEAVCVEQLENADD